MDYSDIDQFFGGIPWNRTFYGARCSNGHWIWGSNVQDIVNYPDRVKFIGIEERPFGVVREQLIMALERNHLIGGN